MTSLNATSRATLRKYLSSFGEIPSSEMDSAVSLFRPVSLRPGALFVEAGERSNKIGFVHLGVMRLYYLTRDGTEITKAFCAENSVATSYSAILTEKPSRFFIEALEETSLFVAGYDECQSLTKKHPCWETVFRHIAEFLFILKEEREADFLLHDATGRYKKFLQEYPGLDKRVQQRHIASYLGITPVSLSRIRANLKMINKC